MNGPFRLVSGRIRHIRLTNPKTDDRFFLMTNIDFAGPATSYTGTFVRIVARGPRLSPRDACAADQIIVGYRHVYRRPVERRVSPRITVSGMRR